MDAFVKVCKQKSIPILGREGFIRSLRELIERGGTLCVYGNPGIGKTYTVKKVLENYKYTEIDNGSNIQFELLRDSPTHVLVDNFETDGAIWRELNAHHKLSKGTTILITNSIKNIDFCDCIRLDALPVDIQERLILEKYPTSLHISENIKRADGNLRNLFHYMDGSDDKDIFLTPKDFVYNLLTSEKSSRHIGEIVDDHGFSWGIVHENYTDARLSLEDCAEVIDDLSIAENVDTLIYKGNWEYLQYFCHHGIVKPAIKIDNRLNKECIRPGSAWTKFNNYKMRVGKYNDMRQRSFYRLDVDTLMLIRDVCIKDPDRSIQIMMEYKMIPQDLDVLNHLALETKIKTKALQSLKKKLKNALGEQT